MPRTPHCTTGGSRATQPRWRRTTFWKAEVPACARDLSDLHQQDLKALAAEITRARRIALRLNQCRRLSRRSVERLMDAVWSSTNQAEMVSESLAMHLAAYRRDARKQSNREARK